MLKTRIEVPEGRMNQCPVRTIIRMGLDPEHLARARKEREAFTHKLWRMKHDAGRKEYWKTYREKNAEKERARKKKWREENREKYNAYNRRYYELNPARQEYRANKQREYRARARDAA